MPFVLTLLAVLVFWLRAGTSSLIICMNTAEFNYWQLLWVGRVLLIRTRNKQSRQSSGWRQKQLIRTKAISTIGYVERVVRQEIYVIY